MIGTGVLVVDEIQIYRDGLVGLLTPDVARVCGVRDGPSALRAIGTGSYPVALVGMAAADGLAICRELAASEVRVVALAVGSRADEMVACAEAGVSGYLLRDQPYPDLLGVIDRVARGETACPPQVVTALMRRIGSVAAERAPDRLTPREREILSLIDRGMSNKEIARMLFIEVRTVKNHVHNLLEKLKVHRRGEAAAMLRTRPLELNR